MKFDEIKELIKIFDDSGITEIDIKEGDFEILLKKGGSNTAVTEQVVEQVAVPQIPQPTAPKQVEHKSAVTMNSPMVGTFYSAPAPNAQPFVKAGDKVSKGQTIAILEAMKIMNEWESDFDCKIVKVLVEDGQPVEYGSPIFEVERI
ncbi:acetyl-CoA carboxylase, biotin carboxyl carrier protein [Thiovulum sp. ES]|nr:acetyl-CoA carboxylase, biotin carboxyl carrier protein [Thiovulum sp. ES]